ncbi:hypothetical protein [Paenibacillus sp. YN15]|uniref:hypothetical protein n=1 Tax=Paenibacillus sp. YN15 TaxID=1742774 RepID=UPI0011BF0C7A|nr:hypothetical protein [Paenibacillus sp. YN15]
MQAEFLLVQAKIQWLRTEGPLFCALGPFLDFRGQAIRYFAPEAWTTSDFSGLTDSVSAPEKKGGF